MLRTLFRPFMILPETKRLVIYIVGRPHCRSTILDAALGNASRVQGVGELLSGLSRFPDEPVPAGGTIASNPFWTRVRQEFESQVRNTSFADASKTLHQAFQLRNLPRILLGSRNSRFLQLLSHLSSRLYEAICDTAECDIVVDSGKRVTQALFLARTNPDVRIIHLVRNPLDIMASHLKRMREGERIHFFGRRVNANSFGPFLLCILALTWTVGCFLATLAERIAGARAMRIRYEDFVADSASCIAAIGDFIGADLSDVSEILRTGTPLHCPYNIGGNRIRFKQSLKVAPQTSANEPLPRYLAMWIATVSFPFTRVYGYLR